MAKSSDRHLAYSREYYHAHRETYVERNKQRKEAGYYQQWREKNRDRVASRRLDAQYQIAARLRAAKQNAATRTECPRATELEFAEIPWECAVCGGVAEEIDHIVPKGRGGCASAHNLQWLCQSCNRRKRKKLMHEALAEDEFWAWAERTHSGGCVHVGAGV